MDGVAGKERAKLLVQLSGQSLVVREDECGLADLRDDVGGGEGFAAAGHAHERLTRPAVVETSHQVLDGLRLIAGGLKGAD